MYEIYTIKENDTLDSISDTYGIEKELIYELNGIDENYQVLTGNQLVLPRIKNEIFKYYTVKKGDNIYEIAKKNNMDYNTLLKINGLEKEEFIYPNQTLLLPRNNNSIYLTKEGDTLSSIKENLNTDIETILKENTNIYLQPDQMIIYKKIKSYSSVKTLENK